MSSTTGYTFDSVTMKSESLLQLRNCLGKSYPNLMICQGNTSSVEDDLFLDLWKPVSGPQQGPPTLQYLPLFHCIVTVIYPVGAKADSKEALFCFALTSFQGNVLQTSELPRDRALSDVKIDVLDDLSQGNLWLCQGVRDIKAG